MSTTDKGEAFERRVLSYMRKRVSAGQTRLNPNGVQFFHKKAYYSPARGEDIIFDGAVEYRVNEATSTLVWIFECKDRGRAVEIGWLEEFDRKVGQLQRPRPTATFFSTSWFPKSVLTYAKNRGIGLCRFSPAAIDWVLQRTDPSLRPGNRPSERDVQAALGAPDHSPARGDVFGVMGDRYFDDIRGLVSTDLGLPADATRSCDEAPAAGLVPYLSRAQIEGRASVLGRLLPARQSGHVVLGHLERHFPEIALILDAD